VATACVIPSGAYTEAIAVGYIMSGNATIIASVDTSSSAGICLIQVSWIPTSSNNSNGNNSNSGTTSLSYSPVFVVLLDQDCATFTNITALNIIGAFYDKSRLNAFTRCASTYLSFSCTGVDIPTATAYCQKIYTDITNSSSQLNALLKPILSPSNGSSGSNNGLYGLLALLVIPICTLIFVIYWCKQRELVPNAESTYANDFNDWKDIAGTGPPAMNIYNGQSAAPVAGVIAPTSTPIR
jgi:hypothetical protein